ncbi:MAG TPA: CBS domain-containing protein [Dermatophilaceae bacterium]|nr:CBS domain-containing protein [Dermatophilaceae bacterium]
MRISDVLRGKASSNVVTVTSTETIAGLLGVLSQYGIGAVVVSDDGSSIGGIVSERDVVRALTTQPDLLSQPVASIMTTEVFTCTVEMSVEELADLMTDHRIRHVPVVKDGALTSIVSIGDVVKQRISQLQSERDHLAGYLRQ